MHISKAHRFYTSARLTDSTHQQGSQIPHISKAHRFYTSARLTESHISKAHRFHTSARLTDSTHQQGSQSHTSARLTDSTHQQGSQILHISKAHRFYTSARLTDSTHQQGSQILHISKAHRFYTSARLTESHISKAHRSARQQATIPANPYHHCVWGAYLRIDIMRVGIPPGYSIHFFRGFSAMSKLSHSLHSFPPSCIESLFNYV